MLLQKALRTRELITWQKLIPLTPNLPSISMYRQQHPREKLRHDLFGLFFRQSGVIHIRKPRSLDFASFKIRMGESRDFEWSAWSGYQYSLTANATTREEETKVRAYLEASHQDLAAHQ